MAYNEPSGAVARFEAQAKKWFLVVCFALGIYGLFVLPAVFQTFIYERTKPPSRTLNAIEVFEGRGDSVGWLADKISRHDVR
jgi:hypothetical protein